MDNWKEIHAIIEGEANAASVGLPSAGMAVYYYLLHRQRGTEADLLTARRLFGAQLAATAAQPQPAATRGLAALAWLHAQLADDVADVAAEANIGVLDQRLWQRAKALIGTDNQAELWRIIRYFAARLAAPTAAAAPLQEIMSLLYAEKNEKTAAKPAGSAVVVAIPLGPAASLTNEIRLLARIGAAGVARPLVQQQASRRVAALLAAKNEIDFSAGRYSVFPDFVAAADDEPVFSDHLSWMRSADLGAALALYEAQALLHDAELGNIAELVGLNTLLRTEAAAAQLTGAEFCQGAFGVAYAYARLFLLSQKAAYRRCYEFWCEQAQHWLRRELAAGYYQQQPAHCLQGALGTGLMLLYTAAAPSDALLFAEAIEACQG